MKTKVSYNKHSWERFNPGRYERKQPYLERLAGYILEKDSKSPIHLTVRGWCYVLENEVGLRKDEFGRATQLINDCRERGLLPIDIIETDKARDFTSDDHWQKIQTVREFARDIMDQLQLVHKDYKPLSAWRLRKVFLTMIVEKTDAYNLFKRICDKYGIPIASRRGTGDMNQSLYMAERFKEHEQQGRRPVILYCGDCDPFGHSISNGLWEIFMRRKGIHGWAPPHRAEDFVFRLGLNKDFILEHNLSLIPGLKTTKGDYEDKEHKHKKAKHVDWYKQEHGKQPFIERRSTVMRYWKCELEALIARPDLAEKLCEDTINRFIPKSDLEAHKRRQKKFERAARQAIINEFRDVYGVEL